MMAFYLWQFYEDAVHGHINALGLIIAFIFAGLAWAIVRGMERVE